jgi:hypothetical protein
MSLFGTIPFSRFGARFLERRQRATDGHSPALTRDDEENIAAFERLIREAIQLLKKEQIALQSGVIADVASFYQAKSRILKALELRQPLIEPFLKEKIPQIESLRDLLRVFAAQLIENGRRLEGMAIASRAINAELDRIRNRNSLQGMYDKRGKLRRGFEIPRRPISRHF